MGLELLTVEGSFLGKCNLKENEGENLDFKSEGKTGVPGVNLQQA